MSKTVNVNFTFNNNRYSNEVDVSFEGLLELATPDSLGVSTIAIQARNADGDFETIQLVNNDLTVSALQFTVSSSVGYPYDITSVFPAGVDVVRLDAGSAITKTIVGTKRGV